MVQLPKVHQHLCFTVDGRANDVLRLLEDAEKGDRVLTRIQPTTGLCLFKLLLLAYELTIA